MGWWQVLLLEIGRRWSLLPRLCIGYTLFARFGEGRIGSDLFTSSRCWCFGLVLLSPSTVNTQWWGYHMLEVCGLGASSSGCIVINQPQQQHSVANNCKRGRTDVTSHKRTKEKCLVWLRTMTKYCQNWWLVLRRVLTISQNVELGHCYWRPKSFLKDSHKLSHITWLAKVEMTTEPREIAIRSVGVFWVASCMPKPKLYAKTEVVHQNRSCTPKQKLYAETEVYTKTVPVPTGFSTESWVVRRIISCMLSCKLYTKIQAVTHDIDFPLL